MRKVINITGEKKDRGSVANQLGVQAAERGTDMKKHIQEILDDWIKYGKNFGVWGKV